jgi:hypothetical protein
VSKDAAVRPIADLAAPRVALPVLPPGELRSPQQVREPALWAQQVPVSLLLARSRRWVLPELQLERPVPQQEQEWRPRVSARLAWVPQVSGQPAEQQPLEQPRASSLQPSPQFPSRLCLL